MLNKLFDVNKVVPIMNDNTNIILVISNAIGIIFFSVRSILLYSYKYPETVKTQYTSSGLKILINHCFSLQSKVSLFEIL